MRVGFVGWRGMVGSVLMQRMREERRFRADRAGVLHHVARRRQGPGDRQATTPPLKDATDIAALAALRRRSSPARAATTRTTCYPKLRAAGWNGYWIDAASALRMKDDAVIILDPVNRDVIDARARAGHQELHRRQLHGQPDADGAGAACSRRDLVEWMTCMTYQAASGAGAQNMRELLAQMGEAHMRGARAARRSGLGDPRHRPRGRRHPARRRASRPSTSACRSPAACIPWIDKDLGNGMSREEWKGGAETNKILGRGAGSGKRAIPVDSICVRIGAMRCHSQALTIKLTRDVPLRRDRGDARRRQRLGARRCRTRATRASGG